LLLLVRQVSARAMVGLVAAIVVTIGLLGPHVPLMNNALVKFTPDLAVLFAVGLLAATVPAIALMVVKGSTWSSLNLFWLDLTWAPAIGCACGSSPAANARTRAPS
jgi:hypothetical protein